MTTEGPPLTDILAAFVAETPATDVPAATVEPAKNVILDTVGVALAAAGRPVGRIITEHVTQAPGTPATASVLGAGIESVAGDGGARQRYARQCARLRRRVAPVDPHPASGCWL